MVPIRGEWTPFSSEDDKLRHYRSWGLIPAKSNVLRPVMVIDGYLGTLEPCSVVGYQGDNWAVIELPDGYHAIHGEYLAEMQPVAYQTIPRNLCFAQILSDYVILKIKSTGYNRQLDRVIEIAAASYQYGKLVSECASLINPKMILPSDIVANVGITQEDVDSAPTLDEILPNVLSFIGNRPLVGHGLRSFGIPFLSSQLSVQIDNPIIDTIPMAQKAFASLPSHKLDYLKTTLYLSDVPSIRALDDVKTTNELLWACMAPRRYEQFVRKAQLNNVLSQPVSVKKADGIKSPRANKEFIMGKNSALEDLANVLPHYLVLDIETTGFNRQIDRVIEIAAVTYQYGKKESEFTTFVNPEMIIPPDVVNLTGIAQEDIIGAPTIEEIANDFLNYIGNLPIVGHNIRSFDIPFLSSQISFNIKNRLVDTLPIAKKVFSSLPSHKLEYLKSTLRLSNGKSHRALADVESTNALLWACMSPKRYEDIIAKELETTSLSAEAEQLTGTPSTCRSKKSTLRISDITPSRDAAKLYGPLFGKIIVFTGELSMPRNEAMQIAVDAGGILRNSVSSKTSFLVVGKHDKSLVGDDGMSGKEEKAHSLNDSGKCHISIISEAEFLELSKREGAPV